MKNISFRIPFFKNIILSSLAMVNWVLGHEATAAKDLNDALIETKLNIIKNTKRLYVPQSLFVWIDRFFFFGRDCAYD